MTDVIMPKMGDAMEEGTLLRWRRKSGDQVKAGEVIAEVETDKSNVELEAEEGGVLVIQVEQGASVAVGATIATINSSSSQRSGTQGESKNLANGRGSPSQQESAAGNGESRATTPRPAPTVHRQTTAAHTPAMHESYTGPTATMSYSEAIRTALIEELNRDPAVFMLGEEIGQYQGTFKITQGFLEMFGPDRIVDTPISEAGMVGMTIGAAMMGLRPVLEFMTFNFALVAWDQIINHAAKVLYMSGGQYSVPCVLRGPGGIGSQLSAQHSQDLLQWYANTPGLKVVAPATPSDAKGLLKSAIRDNNPVIFMEHAKLYARPTGPVPTDPDFLVPIGVADVKRQGNDVTIVAFSRGTVLALAAAETLSQEGIDVEVVDLRSLQPFDIETVAASIRKTHRAVVVQEQWPFYGVAAEFSAQIMERCFDDLDAPVERVCGAFVPMPYSKALEDLATPHEDDIAVAVRKTLERRL